MFSVMYAGSNKSIFYGMFTPQSVISVRPSRYFPSANLFLERIQKKKVRVTQRQTGVGRIGGVGVGGGGS